MEQAIKFALGTLRTERACEKEQKGNNSGIVMREAVGAPRRLEKGAAEMLKRDNRTHPRTTKKKKAWKEKKLASGHLSRLWEHERCALRCIKQHGQYLGRNNGFGSFTYEKNSNMCYT